MCLILYKKSNLKFNEKTIRKFLENSGEINRDGRGFAINCGDYVAIRKGFKSVDEMIKACMKFKDLDEREIVFHLRNASPNTDISIETTHPIVANSDDNKLGSLDTIDSVLCHNGAFREFNYYSQASWNLKDDAPSDTVAFARTYLKESQNHSYQFLQYFKANYSSKFSDFIGANNKVVIMKAGLKTIVHNLTYSEEGLLMSNPSFQENKTNNGVFRSSANNNNLPTSPNISYSSGVKRIAYDEREVGEFIIKRAAVPLNSHVAIRSSVPFCCSNHLTQESVCDNINHTTKHHFCCKHVSSEKLKRRRAVNDFVKNKRYWNKVIGTETGYKFSDFQCRFLDLIVDEKDPEIFFYFSECNMCSHKPDQAHYCNMCDDLKMSLKVRTKDYEKARNVYAIQNVRSDKNLETFNMGMIITKLINASIADSDRRIKQLETVKA